MPQTKNKNWQNFVGYEVRLRTLIYKSVKFRIQIAEGKVINKKKICKSVKKRYNLSLQASNKIDVCGILTFNEVQVVGYFNILNNFAEIQIIHPHVIVIWPFHCSELNAINYYYKMKDGSIGKYPSAKQNHVNN